MWGLVLLSHVLASGLAQDLTGIYCLQNSKSGLFLKHSSQGVQVWGDCRRPETHWRFPASAEGRHFLQNVQSKQWLTSAPASDDVHMSAEHGALESQWDVEIAVATESVLRNARTSRFLAEVSRGTSAEGDAVQALPDSSEPEARWTISPAPSPGPMPGPGRESVVELKVGGESVRSLRCAEGGGRCNPLTRCVGSGHAWLGLREDWQTQLARVSDEVGFEFVRFHGLLDDDMGVYGGPGLYNFERVDTVYDSVLKAGMRPIVEVSFMPAALARGNDTGFYPKPRSCHVNPPSDYDEWARMIEALGTHLVGRYGEEEVAKWFFEVWNEPNCGFFKTGAPQSKKCCETCADMDEYMKLYKYTAHALRKVSPRLRIGGPATAQLGHVDDFIRAMQAQALDGGEVITSHIYPTDPMTSFLGVFEKIAESVRKGQKFAKTYILSEFNSGLYGDTIGNHDRAFAAAFLVSFASDFLQGKVEIPRMDDFMASYWTFSDIFEEQGFPTKDFQNGFGLLTYKGIPKPAYRIMQEFAFGDDVLNISSNATSSGAAFPVVKALGLRRCSGDKCDIKVFISNLDDARAPLGNASVLLKFSPDWKITQAKVARIDADHTNPREVWEQLGKPELQGTQLQQVLDSSLFRSEELPLDVPLRVTIPAWACAVVTVAAGREARQAFV